MINTKSNVRSSAECVSVARVQRVQSATKPCAWEKQALSARGVHARRKALRVRRMNGMEVRKKRPRGFKKEAQGVQERGTGGSSEPPEPPICCPPVGTWLESVGRAAPAGARASRSSTASRGVRATGAMIVDGTRQKLRL